MSSNNNEHGIWFQSAVSGLWYENPDAAGDLRSVKVNGKRFVATTETSARCEHGILWNMECLSCGPSDFVAAPATPVAPFAEISGLLENHPLREEYEAALAQPDPVDDEHPASAKRLLEDVNQVNQIVAEGGEEFQQEWTAALHAFRGDEASTTTPSTAAVEAMIDELKPLIDPWSQLDSWRDKVRAIISRYTAQQPKVNALNEIEVALISIADGVSPRDAVQKAFEVINRERLAISSRHESGASNFIHLPQYPLNGTQLECDGSELRPDGTCAKCQRINERIASVNAAARCDAIGEAIELAKSKAEEYHATALRWGTHGNNEQRPEIKELDYDDRDQCLAKYSAMIVFAAALEQLKGEGAK